MSVRLAYYCPRLNHLRVFGPVIAEQVHRGTTGRPLVVVPVAPLLDEGGKNRELAAARRLPELTGSLDESVDVLQIGATADFAAGLTARGVGAVVTLGLTLPPAIRAEVVAPTRRAGIRWCALGYVQEELAHVLQMGPRLLEEWDVATTLSADGVEVVRKRLAGHPDVALLDRLRPVGFAELDQVEDFDRRELRRRYGLPEDRPVIYFSTAPRLRLRSRAFALMAGAFYGDLLPGRLVRPWALPWWRRHWPDVSHFALYEEILRELQVFARRHDAVVVAKTRLKHRDPAHLDRYVDRVLGDGSYYPFRTLELMGLADLYVGMPTASAIEAAFLGRPMVHILPFPIEAYENPFVITLRREFYASAEGLWDTPGLARAYRTYRREDWAAFTEWARTGALESSVDPQARARVVRRVLGFDDCKASARFLDLVESAVGL